MGRSIIVLLVCLFIFSFASAETSTQLNISNSPPELLKPIPDILVILDTPKINAFDLDDYFEDANGDKLTFNHTEISNVIITINSENQVSFYPDIGYSGTQNIQFEASDLSSKITSNAFQVMVGLDTEPPQWNNPKKNRISVYQNYHITFTADWTDNVELKEYIFSINQGFGWQNKTVTAFSGKSNKSTFKLQISASQNTLVQWTFYAYDIYNNLNKIDIQNFTVKEFIINSKDIYNGDEAYQKDSSVTESVGYGTGGAKLEVLKQGILADNLEINIRSIKATIKQGSNMTKVVQIINTGNTVVKINASLRNIGFLAQLGDTSFEIAPGETYEMLVEFVIPEGITPDQYFGFLLLDYGKQISIPIVVDIKKFESEIIIKVNLTKNSHTVRAGEKVIALITIKNKKDISSTPSQFYYAIKNFNGIILESKNEEIIVGSIFEEKRELIIPEGIPDGEYIFYARIISEDSIDLDSDTFLVGTKFKIIALLKELFYPITILILIIILILLYLIYKRNKKKKRLLELYLLLNELRSLVKEGKTMQAMDIYKRIKIAYGQHVSKNFMEDEVKLREELAKFSKILTQSEKKTIPVENAKTKSKLPNKSEEKSIEKKLLPAENSKQKTTTKSIAKKEDPKKEKPSEPKLTKKPTPEEQSR